MPVAPCFPFTQRMEIFFHQLDLDVSYSLLERAKIELLLNSIIPTSGSHL
jgi:hypothetical protein